MNEAEPVTELSQEECWHLLREHEFGRLAFRLIDEVHITPINYAVDHGSLLFQTAEGSKLFAVALGSEVAFEIDQFGPEEAVSVVVRGIPTLLDERAAHRAENLPLRPWVGTEKYNVVEIVPTAVTGRRFQLNRPWLRMIPQ